MAVPRKELGQMGLETLPRGSKVGEHLQGIPLFQKIFASPSIKVASVVKAADDPNVRIALPEPIDRIYALLFSVSQIALHEAQRGGKDPQLLVEDKFGIPPTIQEQASQAVFKMMNTDNWDIYVEAARKYARELQLRQLQERTRLEAERLLEQQLAVQRKAEQRARDARALQLQELQALPTVAVTREEYVVAKHRLWEARNEGAEEHVIWVNAVIADISTKFPIERSFTPLADAFDEWVARTLQDPRNDMRAWADFAREYAALHSDEQFHIPYLAKKIERAAKGTLLYQGLDARLVERDQLKIETRMQRVYEYVQAQKAAKKPISEHDAAALVGDLSRDPVKEIFNWFKDAGILPRGRRLDSQREEIISAIREITAEHGGVRPERAVLLQELRARGFNLPSENAVAKVIKKSNLPRLPRFRRGV